MTKYISYTQISTLLRCPRQYEYRYVERIYTPSTPSLVRGFAIHSALEGAMRHKLLSGSDISVDDAVALYATAWHERLQTEEINWLGESPNDVFERGTALLTLLMIERVPMIVPQTIEQVTEVPIHGLSDYTLKVVIDVVDVEGRVIDWKTASRTPSQAELDKDLQPSCYAAARLTDPAREAQHFEYHYAVDNKKPMVVTLSTVRTRRDVEWLVDLTNHCVRQIEAGVFPPNPTGWCCDPRWCGYYERCRGDRQ